MTDEEIRYNQETITGLWDIVRDGREMNYDTNTFYDLVREGVEANKKLSAERERCAGIAEKSIADSAAMDVTSKHGEDVRSARMLSAELIALKIREA